MGLSVGGIYVRTRDRDRVVAAIKKHWLAVGAKELSAGEDPLALQPLSVEKTGKLGYVVFPATRDVDDTEWVAVYDSERYHGSGELAEFLAKELDALVMIYSFTSTVDAASMHMFRGASKQEKWHGNSENWGKVEGAVATLPYAFVYYNQLRVAASTEEGKDLLDGLSIFGFEGMPYREQGYRGPSGEEQRGAEMLEGVVRAVAAGDAAAVRAAYEREVAYRYVILSKVTEGVKRDFFDDPLASGGELAGGQRVVLAMAEELLADPEAYWRVREVAEAAFFARDQALFQRAVAILGRHVSGLAGVAHRLMREKKFEAAVELLRAVIAREDAPLTAWNNLAHALCFLKELPPDAAELLARCDAHGMANSYIFHNTACGWLRLGDRERALQAVRGAVKAGYPELAKLRVDEDLRELFDDPRFGAAFEEGATATTDELVVTKLHEGQSYVVQRPVLRFDFFLEVHSMSRIGPAVAALLEAYLADVPEGALAMAQRNGPWKKLTKAAIAKDVDKLRKARKSSFLAIDYRGETDEGGGAPTEYGVHVDLWGESEEFGAHDKVPVVSVWFPAEQAEGDVDAVAARFARYAALMPVEAGGAGLQVMLRKSDYVEVWWESDLLEEGLKRFLGTELHPWREWCKGKAAGAMWLSYLGAPLVSELGGREALAAQVAPAVVSEAAGGAVIVRASLRPGVGMGPTPSDLGALPKVARAIAELTSTKEGAQEDPRVHYRRLFEVPVTEWTNGAPVVADAAMRAKEAGAAGAGTAAKAAKAAKATKKEASSPNAKSPAKKSKPSPSKAAKAKKPAAAKGKKPAAAKAKAKKPAAAKAKKPAAAKTKKPAAKAAKKPAAKAAKKPAAAKAKKPAAKPAKKAPPAKARRRR